MRLNQPAVNRLQTHEGAPASAINPEQALRRSVLTCLLFEKEFYEDGESIATRIENLVDRCSAEFVSALALEARSVHNLRHVPLLLMSRLGQTGKLKAADLAKVIQRADELGEFLSIFWRGLKSPIPAQIKKGLALAFDNFDEYQLAKYDRDSKIKLRDVMRLVHPNPGRAERSALFKGVINRSLASPSTWEVLISAVGKDTAKRKEIWESLLNASIDGRPGGIGYLALLRNLRNMLKDNVREESIHLALQARRGAQRVLPFRYIAAARAAPRLEPIIDVQLRYTINELPRLKGKTGVLVDVSSSMTDQLSAKSDLTRMDAAAALASVINAESLRVFSFSSAGANYYGSVPTMNRVCVEVPPRRGMSGVDAVINSQSHGGTLLGKAVHEANEMGFDRLIVITDEQSQDPVPEPTALKAYMINVASAQNGVGYGRWTHIDGFSESVLKFIAAHEAEPTLA